MGWSDAYRLSVSTISKIELGNVGITVESIFRLCEFFGIDMIDFFKYLNDDKEYLESIGVQVYVDRSLKVKGVDKRVVSYEIEKKYEGIATSGVILPPTEPSWFYQRQVYLSQAV